MDKNVTASHTKHKRTTLERIDKYISDKYFTDVNLYGRLYPDKREVSGIKHWKVPGGVGEWIHWDVQKILKMKDKFTSVKIGDSFGPSWSTHWFIIYFEIPHEWKDKEIRFRFKSQSEAMVWSMQGVPLQGLSSGTTHQIRSDFLISRKWNPDKESKSHTYLIEMSGSRMFGVGKGGMINPPNPEETFTLEMVEVFVLDTEMYSLFIDLQILHDLSKYLDDDQRGYLALYAGNQIINDLIKGDVTHAKSISRDFFSRKNGQTTLTMALIGNCHIDSAWLWPCSETIRKCGRSWASTIKLMEEYPEMIFACSQAQQFEWVKTYYPDLYAKIKDKNKEGAFVHVGATWVEMDGLIPSGESFIRQFLYGQKFYKEEFGSESNIFWLPDTFGYSAQIPQICNHFGIRYFLTQKLSWNLVNKFPHHTFKWEGIDGTTVLTHFPPGDSYEMNVNVEEALKTEKNLSDKGRVNTAGFLYGYGDGGGGPTQDMLERAKRLADVDGCPKMKHMHPHEMFSRLESENRNLCKWVGELYLELHNGTYTSQAKTKWFNRKSEFELRKTEILLSMVTTNNATTFGEISKRREECEKAWKKVLLNQFHDVLPGSSIGLVYEDSNKLYEEVLKTCKDIYKFCIEKLSQERTEITEDKTHISITNMLPWDVSQIIEVKGTADMAHLDKRCIQVSLKDIGMRYLAVEAPALCYTGLNLNNPLITTKTVSREAKLLAPPSVRVEKHGRNISMENQFIYTYFTSFGELTKLVDKRNKSSDVFRSGEDDCKGNIFTLYDDVPLFWDAWDVMDYHVETRTVLNSVKNENLIQPLVEIEHGPLRAELYLKIEFGSSHWAQKIVLTAVDPFVTFENEVDWKETHKFLKVEFKTGLLARNATFDIQFGHIQRATHQNTSWDSAKFEVSGHKWANISEYDCGLSILNDSKYGWSALGGTLVLSLLRAPKAPDDKCDIGKHYFKFSAMPHKGSLQRSGTIEAAYELNSPLIHGNDIPLSGGISEWLKIIGEGVMIEAVKVAEGSSKSIVVRLYEMFGGISDGVSLKISFEVSKAWDCYGNEAERSELPIVSNIPDDENPDGKCSYVKLTFGPFNIKTIKLILK